MPIKDGPCPNLDQSEPVFRHLPRPILNSRVDDLSGSREPIEFDVIRCKRIVRSIKVAEHSFSPVGAFLKVEVEHYGVGHGDGWPDGGRS